MTDRLVVDLGGDGMAGVLVWPDDGGVPERVSHAPLAWPLDADALEDLRWYLEDYLLAPFGVWDDRGPAVHEKLASWGEQVFESVFGPGPARDAYQRARDKSPEVVFRSKVPGLLGLPWELMRDGAGPVALRAAGGISRSLPVADGAGTHLVPDGRLRVLMVICRPAGTADVGYQMIARPLLERLEAVHGGVDLAVLRPPTFDALRHAVKQAAVAGEPFHVVHFDGHGAMPDRPGSVAPGGRPAMMARAGEGMLAFERPDGGSNHVGASKLAAVLHEGNVPVAVLNACQSGAVGKELEASVATALLRSGCAAVVAMAYSVYAIAAAEFMAAFYEALFAGDSVGQAVIAGRRRLSAHDARPSPKGDMPLADWLVPVHYMRAEVRFPYARANRRAATPSLDETLDQLRAAPVLQEASVEDPLAAVGSFISRDDLFYQLEAAARLLQVLVLTGPGGAGKTELAKGFARWWRDTGGVDDPRLVCWHSFEPGVASFGLDGVISALGRQVGDDFSRMDPAQRLAAVKHLLGQHRGLLVWDNFESVAEMPDPAGATSPLDQAGRTQLREFLAWVRDHSASTVIITSRAREDWLGQVRRIAVGGLNRAEAVRYAGYLLAPFPAARQGRERRSFGELLEWLDGHPLAMRLTLPRLDAADPADLLAGLRGTTPLPGGDNAGLGRLSSLGACITYSFTHLSERTRLLLPAVSLLHGTADENLMTHLSAAGTAPARFAGISRQEWTAALQDAARVGLLTGLGAGMYQIHPALPGYLAAGWQSDNPDGYGQERDACEKALRAACTVFSRWLTEQIDSGDAALAYRVIELQRRTFGVMLGHALDHHAWDDANAIVRALDAYWDARGLREEAAAWVDRILAATVGPRQDPLGPASLLWLHATARQASWQMNAGQPDKAAQTYRRALAYLQDQPATDWTRESISAICHELGITAQRRKRLAEAEDWYRKSLAISEELGNRPRAAGIYHQLGSTAAARGRLDEADDWYRQAIQIREELGLRALLATDYHQLGRTAQDRGRLDEAEDWYRKSLAIKENLGDPPGMAITYHQLGVTAYLRGRLDEAEDLSRKSLVITEELDDRPTMALTYAQLGLIAEGQAQAPQALAWNIRSVTLFSQFPTAFTGTAPSALARLTRQLGMPVLEHAWQQITDRRLPQQVRDYITSPPPDESSQP